MTLNRVKLRAFALNAREPRGFYFDCCRCEHKFKSANQSVKDPICFRIYSQAINMAASSCIRIQIRGLKTLIESNLKHTHLFNPKLTPPRQAWIENFVGNEKQLLGIVDLHPRVFGVFPRIDFVSEAIFWQKSYRSINYLSMPTRNELPGGTRKPWPQKGTGRARHGSTNSPIWLKGGWVRGPRGPVTGFKPKNHFDLVNALRCMFTIKLAQDDLKVVDNIESFTSRDPKELEEAFAERNWGPSVLIVDKRDIFPKSLMAACSEINHVNMMPTQGVNTLSLCKHETLVITLDALREIEDRILLQLVRTDLDSVKNTYREG